RAGNCVLVISLPASGTQGSPHTQADDAEVGGIRGREALERLRNVVGRVESSWRPATAEEGFEIVRRRLFEPLAGPDAFKQRDVTASAFADLYHAQSAEFPPECRGGDYEKRIQAAYPIHPEIFDRLYTDWSTLVKFQRTRGVLRLMAAVIHSLWEKGDRNPLILPSTVPIDDARVQSELTRYLSDNWAPIIEKDVDGPNSLPLRIDAEQPNLGKLHATRRVARTIYLGSAPTTAAAHRGLEDRRVKLGCVMPGESPAVFGDALRRLAAAATYLYQDGSRFWYATQPTVTKLAADRARLPDLYGAVRKFIAWESILAEKDTLNLDPHQVRQAETQGQAADSAVTALLPESYQWLLVPEQANPETPITWSAIRLSSGDALAVRASKRLRSDELLLISLGSTILRKHLDDVPLWRGDHVAVRQVVEDFARYLYLPRVAGPEVLVQAIRDGVAMLTWQTDTFAYAESRDEGAGRYRGLRGGQVGPVSPESAAL